MIYTAHWPRMHPSDFRVRSLDGVADDWPIDYWTLEPFYDENDRMMGVSGLAGDPGVSAAPAADAADAARQDRHALRAGDEQARLALVAVRHHASPRPTTRAARSCINLGHCTPGCAQGAKASTDITYWPLAIRAGVELRTRCRVREITTDEHGMAAGAIYYDADGVEQFQPAEVVILACNGIGTPRLLLNSASARFPDGLANSSGLVGKNLMLHPWPQVSRAMSTRQLDGGRGADHRRCGASSSTRPIRRAASCAATRCSSTAAPARRTRRSPACAAGRLPWGSDHHRVYRELLRPSPGDRRRLRGPAGGAQPRHARSRAEGQPRHPGAEDRLHAQREHAPHDGARHRPRRGDPDRRRRDATYHCSRTVLN